MDSGTASESTSPPRENVSRIASRILPMCTVCLKCRAKYTCPRCGVQTCSLECCRAHKSETSCTGKRDDTGYVSVSTMNCNTLRSDMAVLKRSETASLIGKRVYSQVGDGTATGKAKGRERGINKVRKVLRLRGGDLETMPGLVSSTENRTHVSKAGDILWTVAVRYVGAEAKLNFAGVVHGKLEGTSVKDVIADWLREKSTDSPSKRLVRGQGNLASYLEAAGGEGSSSTCNSSFNVYIPTNKAEVGQKKYEKASINDTIGDLLKMIGNRVRENVVLYIVEANSSIAEFDR